MKGSIHCFWILSSLLLFPSSNLRSQAAPDFYPHNGTSCQQCHAIPIDFGSSPMTVFRVGSDENGKFVPGPESGILHRHRLYDNHQSEQYEVIGERVTISLLGDGYIEAIDPRDIEQNAVRQRRNHTGIFGIVVRAPVLESRSGFEDEAVGRFGWKSQHSSLLSACADSLRNELGVRNRLYPDEYPNHRPQDSPTPIESASSEPDEISLDQLVARIRQTQPPARDLPLATTREAKAGERIFASIGCAFCHTQTYTTMPPETLINAGTYRIPTTVGATEIHPYSDFLLHDVGTGDGIPESAIPKLLDETSANRFRTPPLWGLHTRGWLMHDGKSATFEDAIKRHRGEAEKIRRNYEQLKQLKKRELATFLNSL